MHGAQDDKLTGRGHSNCKTEGNTTTFFSKAFVYRRSDENRHGLKHAVSSCMSCGRIVFQYFGGKVSNRFSEKRQLMFQRKGGESTDRD